MDPNPNYYVVLVDNDPNDPTKAVAFFRDEAAATAWRDANSQGASVRPVVVNDYFLQALL
jgi:hypothetical protein